MIIVRSRAPSGGGASFFTLTYAHGMFPSTQTDIEIWFSLTDPALKSVANGGSVANANHRRIASDSAGTTLLKYDIITPTATTDSTGLIEGFFMLASGSASVDTVVYLAYNDNGVTTYQGDRVNVWARKTFVNHGSRDGSTLSFSDESGNGNTLSASASPPTVVTGRIGYGVNCVAASSQHEHYSSFGPAPTSLVTVSAWVYPTASGAYKTILGNGHQFTQVTAGFVLDISDTSKIRFFFTQGGNNFKIVVGSTTLSVNTWYYFVGTYDGAHINVYVNGVVDATPVAQTGNVQSAEGSFDVGGFNNGGSMDGRINAPRADTTHVDSADRILAQYRNQNALGTYLTVS